MSDTDICIICQEENNDLNLICPAYNCEAGCCIECNNDLDQWIIDNGTCPHCREQSIFITLRFDIENVLTTNEIFIEDLSPENRNYSYHWCTIIFYILLIIAYVTIPYIFYYFTIVLGLINVILFLLWLSMICSNTPNDNKYIQLTSVTGLITFAIFICVYINTTLTIFFGLIFFLLWFNIINVITT